MFKIISIFFSYRLATIGKRIISPNQNGFNKRRHIKEGIGVTHEAINMLSKRVKGGNVVLRLTSLRLLMVLIWILNFSF